MGERKAYLVTHYVRVEVTRLVYATTGREAVEKDRNNEYEASWAEDVAVTSGTARRHPKDDPND